MTALFLLRRGFTMNRAGATFRPRKRKRLYLRIETEREFNAGPIAKNLRRYGIKKRVREMLKAQKVAAA